jgi:hypothetical protein
MPKGHALPVIAQVRVAAAPGAVGDFAAAAALLEQVLADATGGPSHLNGGSAGAPSPQAPGVARALAVARLHLAATMQRSGPADNPWELTEEGAAEAAAATALAGLEIASVASEAEAAGWKAFALQEALDPATPDMGPLGEALQLVGLARAAAGEPDAVDYLQQATRTCRDGERRTSSNGGTSQAHWKARRRGAHAAAAHTHISAAGAVQAQATCSCARVHVSEWWELFFRSGPSPLGMCVFVLNRVPFLNGCQARPRCGPW